MSDKCFARVDRCAAAVQLRRRPRAAEELDALSARALLARARSFIEKLRAQGKTSPSWTSYDQVPAHAECNVDADAANTTKGRDSVFGTKTGARDGGRTKPTRARHAHAAIRRRRPRTAHALPPTRPPRPPPVPHPARTAAHAPLRTRRRPRAAAHVDIAHVAIAGRIAHRAQQGEPLTRRRSRASSRGTASHVTDVMTTRADGMACAPMVIKVRGD